MTLRAVDLHAVHAGLNAIGSASHVGLDDLAHLADRQFMRHTSGARAGDGRWRNQEGHDARSQMLPSTHVELSDQEGAMSVANIADAAQTFDCSPLEDRQRGGTERLLRMGTQGLGDNDACAARGERAIEGKDTRPCAVAVCEIGGGCDAHDAIPRIVTTDPDWREQIGELPQRCHRITNSNRKQDFASGPSIHRTHWPKNFRPFLQQPSPPSQACARRRPFPGSGVEIRIALMMAHSAA